MYSTITLIKHKACVDGFNHVLTFSSNAWLCLSSWRTDCKGESIIEIGSYNYKKHPTSLKQYSPCRRKSKVLCVPLMNYAFLCSPLVGSTVKPANSFPHQDPEKKYTPVHLNKFKYCGKVISFK